MSTILELNAHDIDVVAGGEQTIIEQLEERFPFGEWRGSSFCPFGCPDSHP